MQKQKRWIYLLLAALFLLFLLLNFDHLRPMSNNLGNTTLVTPKAGELAYYFVGSKVMPSFDPEDGDALRNTVHLDHLVGTLLKEKYGNSGRTEHYLAERWEVSSDGLLWTFFLHSGLTCEDGSLID